jgi:four helix bundle protein
LAEGSSRSSAKDKANFTTMAYSSLMEVYNHLVIAVDLAYIKNEDLIIYRKQIQKLSVKLSNLKASQLKKQ